MTHSSSNYKLESPSAERNKEPIWSVLGPKVLQSAESSSQQQPLRIVEIAAGAGGKWRRKRV
jgi:hypothetical protein